MSVLGMLAIGGVQAQSGNGGSALLKTLPMEQAGIVSNLRDAGPAYWDLANAATDYAGGTGTEADPYQIETPQQLMKLCVDATGEAAEDGSFGLVLSGKYFKQTADIDLSGAYANLICIGGKATLPGIMMETAIKSKDLMFYMRISLSAKAPFIRMACF